MHYFYLLLTQIVVLLNCSSVMCTFLHQILQDSGLVVPPVYCTFSSEYFWGLSLFLFLTPFVLSQVISCICCCAALLQKTGNQISILCSSSVQLGIEYLFLNRSALLTELLTAIIKGNFCWSFMEKNPAKQLSNHHFCIFWFSRIDAFLWSGRMVVL